MILPTQLLRRMGVRRAGQRHGVADSCAVERLIGHRSGGPLREGHDLAAESLAAAERDRQLVTDPALVGEPDDLQRGLAYRDHPPYAPVVGDAAYFLLECGEVGEHLSQVLTRRDYPLSTIKG